MTVNQVAYWQLQEQKRANVEKERENKRSHIADEAERNRSNVAKEAISGRELAEKVRSNKAHERITESHYDAQDVASLLNVGTNVLSGMGKVISGLM